MMLKNGSEISVIPASENCFALLFGKITEKGVEKDGAWVMKVEAFKVVLSDIDNNKREVDGLVQLVPILQEVDLCYLEDEGGNDQIKFIGSKEDCEKRRKDYAIKSGH